MDSSSIPKICSALTIWRWQDFFEIFFVSIVFYYVSRWLAQHINKKLLFLSYFYCICMITSYFADLTVVFSFLITAAPIAAMLLILMHQETIQKNFIVAQRIIPAENNLPWVETLVQCCMIANGENKDIYTVIQRNDDISLYLKTKCPLNCLMHKDLLQTIIKSPLFEHEQFLWLQSQGSLVGINCCWQNLANKLLPDALHSFVDWQEKALTISAKTDALIFKSDHKTNSFSIIIHGSLAEKITAHNCVKLIYDYIQESSFSPRDQSHDQKKPNKQTPASHS